MLVFGQMEVFMESIVVSISEAARALSLGRSKVYELINAGDLGVIKVGRRTLITVDSIRNFVQSKAA